MSDSSKSGLDSIDTPELRRRAAEALAPFGYRGSARGEMTDAYLEAPNGVDELIADVLKSEFEGRLHSPPAGALLALVRKGDHLRIETRKKSGPGPRRTGWRMVRGRGGAALTYVEDPHGTDPLPDGYDLVTHPPQTPGQWRDAEKEVELAVRATQEQLREDGDL